MVVKKDTEWLSNIFICYMSDMVILKILKKISVPFLQSIFLQAANLLVIAKEPWYNSIDPKPICKLLKIATQPQYHTGANLIPAQCTSIGAGEGTVSSEDIRALLADSSHFQLKCSYW